MQQECSSKRTEGLTPEVFEKEVFVRQDDDKVGDEYEADEYYDYDEDYSSRGKKNQP